MLQLCLSRKDKTVQPYSVGESFLKMVNNIAFLCYCMGNVHSLSKFVSSPSDRPVIAAKILDVGVINGVVAGTMMNFIPVADTPHDPNRLAIIKCKCNIGTCARSITHIASSNTSVPTLY